MSPTESPNECSAETPVKPAPELATEPTAEIDPQELLPSELRARWAVVPRDTLWQLVLVGMILGAGLALSVAGLVVGSRVMWFGLPVALGLAQLQNWVLPWEKRARRDLEGFVSEQGRAG